MPVTNSPTPSGNKPNPVNHVAHADLAVESVEKEAAATSDLNINKTNLEDGLRGFVTAFQNDGTVVDKDMTKPCELAQLSLDLANELKNAIADDDVNTL